MTEHRTATREEWLATRKALLEQEKELTRRSDELARLRQELPWVAVAEEYKFETNEGTKTLSDLFAGHSQLLVYHLMYGPEDTAACSGCSFTADHLDGAVVHLEHRDVTFLAVSRAPLETLNAYKRRDINLRDEELHGLSAFALEDGVLYHVYSCYDRGTDVLNGTWQLPDRAPKGRGGDFDDWPRRHDEYSSEVFAS